MLMLLFQRLRRIRDKFFYWQSEYLCDILYVSKIGDGDGYRKRTEKRDN